MTAPILDVFIPGRLRNPLNGSWGGWRKHARLARDWRERTAQHLLVAGIGRTYATHPLTEPKHITFTAYVGAPWDDDNLPGAIKPVRDALVGLLIHSDAKDSGHVFLYRQQTRREARGVGISVTPLYFFARLQDDLPPAGSSVGRGTLPVDNSVRNVGKTHL